MLTRYLEDLEARIDDKRECALYDSWIDFIENRTNEEIFAPQRKRRSLPGCEWPDIRINAAIDDIDSMLLSQYCGASAVLSGGDGSIMNVRANYGTGIMPSLFGATLFMMEDKLNTLPATHPLPGGADTIRKLIGEGIPDLTNGFGSKVLEVGRRFVEIGNSFPLIGKHVHIYHPDLQGPMDVVEMLWGSDIFIDLIDEPELVEEFLSLITETYIAFLKEWHTVVPPDDSPYSAHWGTLIKGKIMLRDDSAMNLSPEMFDRFVKPYDHRLLEEFGGGCVHFCGRGDHFIASACSIPNMHAIYMSQPEYNNMETIYQHTVDKGIMLGNFSNQEAERALNSGRKLNMRVHCREAWTQRALSA